MLCALYTDEGFDAREKNDAMFEYQDLDSCAKEAVRYADALIRELKNKIHTTWKKKILVLNLTP